MPGARDERKEERFAGAATLDLFDGVAGALPPSSLARALAEAKARQEKGHPRYYKPLPPELSALVRAHWASGVALPLGGSGGRRFFTPRGSLLATGYRRVVVGDYGAYVEFGPDQVPAGTLVERFAGAPARAVKYIWMVPRDGSGTKVYKQLGTVGYADYLPGHYYVAPGDVTWDLEG